MKYSDNKDINNVVRRLIHQGWMFFWGGKHGRLVSPSGNKLTVPSSPSDHRSLLNFIRDIRKIQD
jgi:hypothetical protein